MCYHTVRKGETLWGIARRYGISLEVLLEWNPGIKNPNYITMGQKVRVRVADADTMLKTVDFVLAEEQEW